MQVRVSPVVVDRGRQGRPVADHAPLPPPGLAVHSQPAGSRRGRLVRETQAHQQPGCRQAHRRTREHYGQVSTGANAYARCF